jgi:fibrillarin-like pre-rRNA processing protein
MEMVEVIYCDVAQPEQARILADNVDVFLKNEGAVLFVIKARSINSSEEPAKVFEREVDVLRHRGLSVKEIVPLEPYDRDHVMVLAELKKNLF